MNLSRVIVVLAFVLVLAMPLLVRQTAPAGSGAHAGASEDHGGGARQQLIVVTPHIEQIRDEFGAAFADWHTRTFPDEPPVVVDWRAPGGTTEILKLLQAVYQARLKQEVANVSRDDPARLRAADMRLGDLFPAGSIDFDLMFGGGSYDHTRLKDLRNVSTTVKPFSTRGVEQVTIQAPKEKLTESLLATIKEITTEVKVGGVTLRLRVPLEAIEAAGDAPGAGGGARAVLEPLTRGGGSVECRVDLSRLEREAAVRMSVPAGFSEAQMRVWFGSDAGGIVNAIGSGQLFQDERKKSGSPDDWQYWIGTALSGFGIVYNAELLKEASIPAPTGFADLRDFRYYRRLSLADPRQSGSVATLYDSILNQAVCEELCIRIWETLPRDPGVPPLRSSAAINRSAADASNAGWVEGWRIIRELCANAHSFSSASTFPPMVVSQGEALAGVCIDFYGRGQAQAVLEPGQSPESGRVGYIDPPGRVFIDADPASILLGGPNPTLARRFVEFCLTPEGQALWQFSPVGSERGKSNPVLTDPAGKEIRETRGEAGVRRMGPRDNALRRMPARPDMYRLHASHFVDQADPFRIASPARSQGWRDGMIAIMGAMIDVSDDLRSAWEALNHARRQSGFSQETLAEMERLFYAMPTCTIRARDGSSREVVLSPETYKEVSAETGRWRDPIKAAEAKIRYTTFFRANFRKVQALARQERSGD